VWVVGNIFWGNFVLSLFESFFLRGVVLFGVGMKMCGSGGSLMLNFLV